MSAIGDNVGDIQSIADNDYLVIQPPATEHWTIHNIYVDEDVETELYYYDGVNEIFIGSNLGSWLYYAFHVTNSIYLRVKNVSGSTALIGYDGVVVNIV